MNYTTITITAKSSIILIALTLLSGCSILSSFLPEREIEVPIIVNTAIIELKAKGNINPDTFGEASPVVVRLYELSDDSSFKQQDFYALYDDADNVLNNERINQEEYLLVPGKTLRKSLTLSPDTKFIGIIAAFRDIDNASWKHMTPILPGEVLYKIALDGVAVEFN